MDNLVSQAEGDLRVIRSYMERSKRYSNFAGLSGVFGGVYAILGAVFMRVYTLGLPAGQKPMGFAITWLAVIALSLGTDYVSTRRRENLVEKAVIVRLTRHMARVALPALISGIAISICFIHAGQQDLLYPYWMLAYGSAIAALGISAPREVSMLGWSFVLLGAFALFTQSFGPVGLVRAQFGLVMFMFSFGCLHIVYGVVVARREGW